MRRNSKLRRGQGMQHVMKMLRHMWVGWGWGGVGHWQRSCWCYATHSSTQQPQGTRYATCDEDATPHVGWVGMGWGGALINSCWCYATHRSTQQPQGTRYATCDEDATPHVDWVGMGWGTDNLPVDATQFSCWMAFGRFSKNCCFQFANSREVRSPCRPALAEQD